jgi:hypothetical protein
MHSSFNFEAVILLIYQGGFAGIARIEEKGPLSIDIMGLGGQFWALFDLKTIIPSGSFSRRPRRPHSWLTNANTGCHPNKIYPSSCGALIASTLTTKSIASGAFWAV